MSMSEKRMNAVLDPVGTAHRLAELEAENARLRAEVEDYTAIGDLLQSEASRLAEWAENQGGMPYEVHQAFHSVRSAVRDWTRLRVAFSRDQEPST